MSNANKSSYKWLVSKSRSRGSKKREFDQRFNSTLNKLFPRTAPAQKKEKNYDKLISDLEKNYNKKLSQQQKAAAEQAENAAQQDKKSSDAISNLSQQVDQGNKRFEGLSKGVQEAFDKLQAQKNQSQQTNEGAAQQATGEEAGEERRTLGDDTYYDRLLNKTSVDTEEKAEKKEEPVSTTSTTSTTTTEPITTTAAIAEEPVIEKVIRTSLDIDDTIDMGNGLTYRATNLYGPRSGKNYVPGRKSGEHSRGIDVVGESADGRSNVPISIADGKIVKIWKQGSGANYSTFQGKGAGYVMDVLSPNGKVITYGHLGPEVFKNKDKYIGKHLKRGDIITEDTNWSGSGSGPHVKVFMSDSDKKGRSLRNYTENGNDPTYLILNGKYL